MAEYVLLHILSRERYLLNLAAQQQRREWRAERYRGLGDLTLGIMGLGSIGGHIAQIARRLGLQVWGLRRGGEPVAGIDKTFTADRLDEFLAGPDYIVNVLPSTPATVGLLSGGRLRVCRPGAVLINIGRGDIIGEADLIAALNEGWIAGAVLDVFEQEPLPEKSPLWDRPGVTITPHVAALGMATGIVDLFAANLERYRAGQQLEHLVDWEQGY
jgi:phosphoglycerate dehydrogenase-like enzyme